MKKNDMRSLTLTAVFAAIIMLMSLIPQIGFVTIFPGVSVTLVHIPVLIGVFLLPKKYSWYLGLFFGLGSLIASALYAATPFDYAFIYPWISVLPRILFVVAAAYIYDGFKWLFTKFKDARVFSFSLIALITLFALFFGIRAITHNVAYNDYTTAQTELAQIEASLAGDDLNFGERANLMIDQAQLQLQMPQILSDAEAYEASLSGYTIPLSLVLATVFIGLYFNFIVKDREEFNIYPSAIIISTLAHTVLVLGAVVIFRPGLFYDTFGTSQSVLTILYSIAAANGLIEALVATVIGVPIIMGLKNLSKKY